jgi:Spy/CpxP family protein refolding chaperone
VRICGAHVFLFIAEGAIMNRFQKYLPIGAIVIGLSGCASAAQGDQATESRKEPAKGWMQGHRDGQFRERMAKRQAELHDKLNLTASQEPAWQAFVAAITPTETGRRPDRAEWENLSAPERMEKMLDKMKQRETQMAARLSAMKAFYATLTPEQQKIFNDNVGKGHGHRHGR